jgi:hypothetical protein
VNRFLRTSTPAAITALLVIFFGLLYGLGYTKQYMILLTYWGAYPFQSPFVDTHAVLSAIECYRRGIDVYVENPCDVLGRSHVYSPLWLAASILPVTTAWTTAAGLACVALFLLSLTLLPPGRGWRQTGVITLGTISSVTAFAIERANIDIIIFALAVLAVRLVQRSQPLRLLGYSVALLAGMLKFYPATLMILALRERLAVFVAVSLVSACAVAGFVALYARDLPRVLVEVPSWGYFNLLSFGARDLPYGIAQIAGWPNSVALGLLIVLTIASAGYAAVLARRGSLVSRLEALSAAESSFLLIGCVLFIGCFFTAQNLLYRGIHLLFVLPGLTAIARRPDEGYNLPLVAGCILVLLLMWGRTIETAIDPALQDFEVRAQFVDMVWIWVLKEIAWWGLATMLVALLIALLRRSQLAQDLSTRLTIRRP